MVVTKNKILHPKKNTIGSKLRENSESKVSELVVGLISVEQFYSYL